MDRSSLHDDTGSTRALVTLAFGGRPEYELARSLFRRYAARFGLDLVVIERRRIRYRPRLFNSRLSLHCEKFQIAGLLARYERILYLDGDVLVAPEAPDVFGLVPADALGCVFENVGSEAWQKNEEMDRAQARHGTLEAWDGNYFNAGVLVLSRRHRDLLTFDRKHMCGGRWPDQTTLNYRAVRLGLKRQHLGPDFNLLPVHEERWNDPQRRRAGFFIHYAGAPAKPLLPEDHAVLEARWAQAEVGA